MVLKHMGSIWTSGVQKWVSSHSAVVFVVDIVVFSVVDVVVFSVVDIVVFSVFVDIVDFSVVVV